MISTSRNVVHIRNSSTQGLRLLTPEEILLVAGGSQSSEHGDYVDDIEVIGHPGGGIHYEDSGIPDEPGAESGGGNADTDDDTDEDPPELTGNGLDEASADTLEAALKGIVAMIDKQIEKYGPDVKIQAGDFVATAGEISKFLGKSIDIMEAGTLLRDASQGNLDVGATASFLVGLVGGAALAAIGSGPLTIFAVTTASGLLTEWAVNEIIDSIETAYNERWEAIETANPGALPSQLQAIFIMDALGTTPTNPGGGTHFEGGSYWGEYNYHIP